ncbi:MAG: hypothetical protein OEM52_08325 [bacterium]|nr:hypothetical protein [bacterium]
MSKTFEEPSRQLRLSRRHRSLLLISGLFLLWFFIWVVNDYLQSLPKVDESDTYYRLEMR